MKTLTAADGSSYTKRMLAYLAAHDEWLGPKHDYTMIHSVIAVPQRAAAFVGSDVVRKSYEDDAEAVFRPIRAFSQLQGIEATFVQPGRSCCRFDRQSGRRGQIRSAADGLARPWRPRQPRVGSVAAKVLAKCSAPVRLVR